MPHIRVVTDSTCDLPDALLKQFDITVVPHMLQFGTETDLVCPDRGPTRCIGGKLLLVGDGAEIPLAACRMIEVR